MNSGTFPGMKRGGVPASVNEGIPLGGLVTFNNSAANLVKTLGKTYLRTGVIAASADFPKLPAEFSSPYGLWTANNLPAGNWFHGAGIPDGIGVVVSTTGLDYLTTTDGLTWTARTLPTAVVTQPFVSYCNGMFFITHSTSSIMTSPDGINWTTRNTPNPMTYGPVVYGNGIYVYVPCNYVTSPTMYMTSTDAITWTTRYFLSVGVALGVQFGNGFFLIVGSGASIVCAKSTDGITWTSPSRPSWTLHTNPKAYLFANGLFGVSNQLGQFAYTADGVTWSLSPVANLTTATNCYFSTIVVAEGHIFATASNGGWEIGVTKSLDMTINKRAPYNSATGIWTGEKFLLAAGGRLISVAVGATRYDGSTPNNLMLMNLDASSAPGYTTLSTSPSVLLPYYMRVD